nr:MAG TPA: hypothetical protein [Bacteriophage sp.]
MYFSILKFLSNPLFEGFHYLIFSGSSIFKF